jgi:hypothetical protein
MASFKLIILFIVLVGTVFYLNPDVKDSIVDEVKECNPFNSEEEAVSIHHDTINLIFQDTQTKKFHDDDLKVVVYDNKSNIIFDNYNDALSRVVLHDIWTEREYKIDIQTGFGLARVYESSQTITFHGNDTVKFIDVERMAFLKGLNVHTREGKSPSGGYLTLPYGQQHVIFIDIGQTGSGVLRDVTITFNGSKPDVIDAWPWVYNNVGVDVEEYNSDSKLVLNKGYQLGGLSEHKSATLVLQVERISKFSEINIIVQDSSGLETKEVKIEFI